MSSRILQFFFLIMSPGYYFVLIYSHRSYRYFLMGISDFCLFQGFLHQVNIFIVIF